MIDGITDKGRKDMTEITFLASSKQFIIAGFSTADKIKRIDAHGDTL